MVSNEKVFLTSLASASSSNGKQRLHRGTTLRSREEANESPSTDTIASYFISEMKGKSLSAGSKRWKGSLDLPIRNLSSYTHWWAHVTCTNIFSKTCVRFPVIEIAIFGMQRMKHILINWSDGEWMKKREETCIFGIYINKTSYVREREYWGNMQSNLFCNFIFEP